MHIIRKEFHFSASHSLNCLPVSHPCSNLHGHNYVVTAEFRSDKLTEAGFVIDYRDLEPIKKWIDEFLDHSHLNDKFFCNPTVENMSKVIFEKWKFDFPTLFAIEMSETPKTHCRYEQNID